MRPYVRSAIIYFITLSPNIPPRRDKKFGIFIDCVFIRHACDVVADGALHAVEAQLRLKILREGFGMVVVVFIHPLQHSSCLDLLALGNGIAVYVLEHKFPQILQRLLHLGRKANRACFPGGSNGIAHQGIDPLGMGITQCFQNGFGNW